MIERRMPAGDQQREVGIADAGIFDMRGEDVAFAVVHADEGDALCVGDGLAAETPTSNAPIKPGVYVTATRSMSFSDTEAAASASRMIGMRFFRCSRDASSGTTPPYFLWMSICEETMLDRTMSSLSTAAAVSSQEVSIPRVT